MDHVLEHTVTDGKTDVGGKIYMGDGKGGLQPVELIKPQHLQEDNIVRKIIEDALGLSGKISIFKAIAFEAVRIHQDLVLEEYGAKVGGAKGNVTLQSVDALYKIVVQVSDHISFGPELQTAKALFDDCLVEWAADARAELRSLVTNAFQTDKAGNINRAAIFMLLRQDSDDQRWKSGQQAIRDAMRITGSKSYIRCYMRKTHDAAWVAVKLDIASI